MADIYVFGSETGSVYTNPTDNVNVYGEANNFSITNGANIVVTSGGGTTNTYVGQDSSETVINQGYAESTTVYSGGSLIVLSGASIQGVVVSGGNVIMSSGAILQNNAVLDNDASITIDAGAFYKDAFFASNYKNGYVTFAGNKSNTLIISGLADGGNVDASISGFKGMNADDSTSIELVGVNKDNVKNIAYVDSNAESNPDYVTFTLTNSKTITLHLIGAESAGYSLGTAPDGSLLYERLPNFIIRSGLVETESSYSVTTEVVNVYGTANNFSVISGATLNAVSGGVINDTQVYNSGLGNVYDGGSAISTIVHTGGAQYIGSGGIADNTVVSGNSAYQKIMSGGVAENTSVYSGGTIVVSTGGITSNAYIYQGGSQGISSDGSAINTFVSTGGVQEIHSGGYAVNTILSGIGAIQSIGDEFGSAIDTIINSGGYVDNYMGVTSGAVINSGGMMYTYARDGVAVWEASSYDATINSGGIEYVGKAPNNQRGYGKSYNAKIYGSQIVQFRGNAYNATIYSGGVQTVYAECGVSNTIISNGGVLRAYGGSIDDTIISSGGNLIGSLGANLANTIVSNGGNLTISSGAHLIGSSLYGVSGVITSIGSGGHLFVSSGATILGDIQLDDGGYATLDVGISMASYYSAGDVLYTGGNINLAGNTNGGLTITGLENGGTLVTTITGFDGTNQGSSDMIKIAGVQQKDVKNVEAKGDYLHLTLTNDKTINLNIVGAENVGYSLGTAADGSLTYEVCFLSGSLIKMLSGEVPIEDIHIGDDVMTFDYSTHQEVVSRVKWIGNKKATVKSWLPDDEAGYPVHIVKDAIAEGVPYKDLLITAEHCLFFDGQFIPVRMLVNGSTIFYDYSVTEYTYYHIETEKHSVITANGLLTESYLDTGNRQSFKQDGDFVLFSKSLEMKSWEKDACHALTVERTIVEPLYHQINERAVDKGYKLVTNNKQLTNDSKLHLITPSGHEIYPFSQSNGKYLFNLPMGMDTVCVASRVSRLCDTIGPFVDNRHHLGVEVGEILTMTKSSIYKISDHLFKTNLSGWHAIGKNAQSRWTKGNAVLPLNHKTAFDSVLSLHILSSNSYFLEEENEEYGDQQAIA